MSYAHFFPFPLSCSVSSKGSPNSSVLRVSCIEFHPSKHHILRLKPLSSICIIALWYSSLAFLLFHPEPGSCCTSAALFAKSLCGTHPLSPAFRPPKSLELSPKTVAWDAPVSMASFSSCDWGGVDPNGGDSTLLRWFRVVLPGGSSSAGNIASESASSEEEEEERIWESPSGSEIQRVLVSKSDHSSRKQVHT